MTGYDVRHEQAGPLAKTTSKTSTANRKGPRRANRPTLGELNDWITANHEALLKEARANCVRLTRQTHLRRHAA